MPQRTIPTVSVVMPAYNAEKYLREAIDSILSQTFGDFEFIIVNDGSTDSTKEIILSYDDPRIVYLENEQNSGICVTLNKGLDAARGRYIARMDADDISLPERFEKQVQFMDQNPEIGIIGCDIESFGNDMPTRIFNQTYDSNQCSAGIIFNPCFAHPTVMWRRDIMDNYNLRYENDYKGLEDLRLWWNFAKVTKLKNIPYVLLRYRHHSSQETKNVNKSKILMSNKFRAERFEAFGITLGLHEKEVLNWYSYGEYDRFGLTEFNVFSNILSKILQKSHTPIITSHKALKIVISKAIVFTINQSPQLNKYKIRLITSAFIKGLIPCIWYIKYMKSILL